MTEKIEELLSQVLTSCEEEEYYQFLGSNNLIQIYDKIMMLEENPDDILTQETLEKIYKIVASHLEGLK